MPLFGRSLTGVGRGSDMTDGLPSLLAKDAVDVLCRSRFLARSRASSNAVAAAEVRLLLVVSDCES